MSTSSVGFASVEHQGILMEKLPNDVAMSSDVAGHHQMSLCAELWSMRSEGMLCDAVLDVEGEQLRAHQVVLSASSPYLKQCCTNPKAFTDCGSALICMQGFSYEVCLSAVEYLYTGKWTSFADPALCEQLDELLREWSLSSLPGTDFSDGVNVIRRDAVSDETCSSRKNCSLSIEQTFSDVSDSDRNQSDSAMQEILPAEEALLFDSNLRRLSRHNFHKSKRVSLVVNEYLPVIPSLSEEKQPKEFAEHDSAIQQITSDTEETSDYDNDCNGSYDNGDDNEDETYQVQPTRTLRVKTNNRRTSRKKTVTRRKLKSVSGVKVQPFLFKRNSCQRCKLVFTSREEYLSHRKKMHPKLRKTWCEVCSKKFPDGNLLQLHNMEHHWQEGMKLAKKYVCAEAGCGFSSFIYATWHKHKSVHHAEPRVCEICGKTLKNEFTLKQHVENMHTRTTSYPCDLCGKTFTTKGNMKAHREARHMDKTSREKLVCPQCAFVCWCKTSMSEHVLLKHNELMPTRKLHQCEKCDFKTTIQTKMKEHMRGHNVLERLACSICGKTYKSVKLLNRHKKIHDNTAKITRCMYCDYTTLHGVGTLSNHLKFKHRDRDPKPWRCDECSHKAITKESLVHHLQYVHKRSFTSYKNSDPPKPDSDQLGRSAQSQADQSMVNLTRVQSTPNLCLTNVTPLCVTHSPSETGLPVSMPGAMHTTGPGLVPGALLTTQPMQAHGVQTGMTTGGENYTPGSQSYLVHHENLVNPVYDIHNMGF